MNKINNNQVINYQKSKFKKEGWVLNLGVKLFKINHLLEVIHTKKANNKIQIKNILKYKISC